MKKFYFIIFAVVTLAGMLAISGCKKKETYTVTFNANGGSGIMAPQTFTIGTAQALSANSFTWENHEFIGWNSAQDGTGTAYTERQEITIDESITLYAQWMAATGLQGGGHYYVDLGLPSGTKWATCNIGANSPVAYGNYYAWGETTTKETYNSSTYTYSGNPTTLPSSADAATANWGTGWRMPTQTEMDELINNCTITWTTQNGVNGRLFTGTNGNSIFLPAAGHRFDSSLYYDGSYGSYWSSSLFSEDTDCAWTLYFYSDYYRVGTNRRDYGLTVRAVCQSHN